MSGYFMIKENKTNLPTEQLHAAKGSVTVELSDEALKNLTGYLDILIQMDLIQKQRNERSNNATNLHCASNSTTQTN
jgi:hypothetical protein